MSILQLTLTAACLAFNLASSTAAPEVRPVPKTCLLQRNAHLKGVENVSNITLEPKRRAEFAAAANAAATLAENEAMSEATGWFFDVFQDKFSPLFNTTHAERIHLKKHVRWTTSDKVLFAVICAALVLLDGLVFQRMALTGLRPHLALVGLWILLGIGYNALVFARQGMVAGVEWCSGYVLEWLLSMDNLFVFHLIFRLYNTPPQLVHKALFLGIIGAIGFRFCFFAIVRELLDFVSWFRFVFGGFLIWSGVQAAKDEEEGDIQETRPVRALRWALGSRLQEGYDKENGSIFVWKDQRLTFTLMLPVVCCLEITDLVFALDSVSAKAAQIPNFWTSVSSSVLAMFGLRAMFFVIQDLVQLFELLKYGLCFILVFIGVELMISDYVSLPPHVVCVVILSVFLISIAGSSAMQMHKGAGDVLVSSPTRSGEADCSPTTIS